MAEALTVAFLVSSPFSVIFLAVKDKKYFRNMCRQNTEIFPVVRIGTLFPCPILQLCMKPRSFSFEDDITTISH